MKQGKLARTFLWVLGFLSLLAALAVLDWYPAVKELGRIRREQNDLMRKIRDYGGMASGFVFPDREEKSLFARERIALRRTLLPADKEDAWMALVLSELRSRARKDRIPFARGLFGHPAQGIPLGTAAPGRPDPLTAWLENPQSSDIQEGFSIAADPDHFPWHGVFAGMESRRGRKLASQGVAVIAAAPLPALLHFINHVSWGSARLEIVRLGLEPGLPLSRAWLVCRGNYLVRQPSVWAVESGSENAGAALMVDADSPLLLRKVGPLFAPRVERRELPPPGASGTE